VGSPTLSVAAGGIIAAVTGVAMTETANRQCGESVSIRPGVSAPRTSLATSPEGHCSDERQPLPD
jgi:hypothetical protein